MQRISIKTSRISLNISRELLCCIISGSITIIPKKKPLLTDEQEHGKNSSGFEVGKKNLDRSPYGDSHSTTYFLLSCQRVLGFKVPVFQQ